MEDNTTTTSSVDTDATTEITLTEVLAGYRESGFDGDFGVEQDGRVRCDSCSSILDPLRLPMHSIRRLEGPSDPADAMVVVATTCPVCGRQGTIVLAYGPMASSSDHNVLTAMRDRRDEVLLPAASSPQEAPGNVEPADSDESAGDEGSDEPPSGPAT